MRPTTNNNRPSPPPPRRPSPARPPKHALFRSIFPPADRPVTQNAQNARNPTSRPLTAVVVTRSPPILRPTTTAVSAAATTRRTTRTPATAAAATSSLARTPLRTRDRNAAWAVQPASTPRFPPPRSSLLSHLSSAATATGTPPSAPKPRPPQTTMRSLKTAASPATGYDKDTPRKPTLASRPIARAPLTPKIASTAAPRTPYATPGQGRDGAVANGPFIASNVTPRSGTRQSRVDSGNTTPQSHWETRPGGLGGPGLSPAASALDERLHTVAAQSSPSASSADSKFFYASDAKPAASGAAALPPPPSLAPPSRASTFFYASGQSLPSPQLQQQQQAPVAASSHPLLSAGPSGSPPPDLSAKFVHANGAALDRPHTAPLKSPVSVMSAPTTAHGALPAKRPAMSARAPPTAVAAAPYGSSQQQRPLSPIKKAPVSPFSLPKRGTFPLANNNTTTTRVAEAPTSQPSSSTPTALPLPSPGPVSPGNGSGRFDLLTRQRTGSSGGGGHSRKGSLTIADPPTVARLLQSSQPNSETSSPAASVHFASPSFPFPSPGGSATSTAATGLAAILQASDDLADPAADEDGSASHAGSNTQGDPAAPAQQETSATSLGASPPPPASSHVDELVANARRERKVQDLEITNASLEAINRSLERQMRKQKAELRQFRRLSRSGRLSLAPSSASATASRVTSSSSTVYEGPLQDPERMFSILSEDDSDGGEDGGYDDGDDYASDMEVSFNEDTAEKDDNDDSSSDTSRQMRRRKRDERRLLLDLSKHRQLLVDSQKINQSIKRCLGWTEALIQEGQKALAFQVRVSEVQLGGRVLAVDELEGDGDVHAIVADTVMEEHAGDVESVDSKQTPDILLADPFLPNVNGAHHDEGHDNESGQDSRHEAFSPISQKSRNVHFDMAEGYASQKKNKTDETGETGETAKITTQATSSLDTPVPSELPPTTAPLNTLPNAMANPVPESDNSPEEQPAPGSGTTADAVQISSPGTEDSPTKTQQVAVQPPAADCLQNGLVREQDAEIGVQAETEPIRTGSVEAVAA